MTAKLVAVERVPNGWATDVAKSAAVVRVTTEVYNGTQAVLPFDPGVRRTTLLHGDLRQEGDQEAGYSYDDPAEADRKALTVDGGTRIPVGGTLRFVESSSVPADALGLLALAVRLPAVDGERVPFTLTGVQDLLEQVQ